MQFLQLRGQKPNTSIPLNPTIMVLISCNFIKNVSRNKRQAPAKQ